MRHLLPLLILVSVVLMGADGCDAPNPPEPPKNFYCAPTVVEPIVEMTALDRFLEAIKNQFPETIVGGTPSVDRRATFFLHTVGVGSCTAVALGPHTALSAAHCLAKDPWNDPIPPLYLYEDPVHNPQRFFRVKSHLMHPEYKLTDKKADLVLLYFEQVLPKPYINGLYDPQWVDECGDIVAQGWGQTEEVPEPCIDGAPKCIRESKYMVDQYANNKRTLITKQRTEGGICFGDSGGPLYATKVGDQPSPNLWLSGITSWTQTHDCKVRSGHVNVDYYKSWILNNFNGPNVPGTFQ